MEFETVRAPLFTMPPPAPLEGFPFWMVTSRMVAVTPVFTVTTLPVLWPSRMVVLVTAPISVTFWEMVTFPKYVPGAISIVSPDAALPMAPFTVAQGTVELLHRLESLPVELTYQVFPAACATADPGRPSGKRACGCTSSDQSKPRSASCAGQRARGRA